MSNDFKKGFLTGAGGITGVLSVPVGIIALIFLFSFFKSNSSESNWGI